MKIPETSANIGAYYGNEENGQWQPNGVLLDSGVGGGVVGSGDAGVQPGIYPHVRHPHIPGYVMAGAYYPPAGYPAPPPPGPAQDFEDYMWMENEEEFDKQVMQQLEEEALMEQCIEAMLEDEQRERRQRPAANGHGGATTSNGVSSLSLEEAVSRSTLNPLAAEFVPTNIRTFTPASKPFKITDDKTDTQTHEHTSTDESKNNDDVTKQNDDVATPAEQKNADTTPQSKDPPEVSAAEIQPISDANKQTDTKTKQPAKKPVKSDSDKKAVNVKSDGDRKPAKEVKGKKPVVVKSESKPIAKKKEVKSVNSEEKVEDSAVEFPPIATPPTEDTGFKPINYAAAAKANKPKKPNEKTPPPSEKTSSVKVTDKTPVNVKVTEKTAAKATEKTAVKVTDKTAAKVTDKTAVNVKVTAEKKPAAKATKVAEKVVQRKNSAK